MIDSKQIYVVNPNYIMKHDTKRVFLSYRYNGFYVSPQGYPANPNHASFIHPEHAKIFALFDGKRDLSEVMDEIASRLQVTKEKAQSLVETYIENKTKLGVTFQGNKFAFPEYLLVPYKKDTPYYAYDPKNFTYQELDFKNHRLIEFPQEVTLMVNTICETNCIYCYADCRKKMDCQIPEDVLNKLIDDCRANQVRNINLMGGEVLKYRNWEWLIKKMLDNGYNPYISTKIPVGKDTVEKLQRLGIKIFQISLDSFDPEIIEKNLHIPNGADYLSRMRNTLSCFEKAGLDIRVHGVITQHNKHIAHWGPYLDELTHYSNIKHVELSIVGESLYKPGFENHKLNEDDVLQLNELRAEIKASKEYPFSVHMSSGSSKSTYLNDKNVKDEKYRNRSLCTGNVRQVFILPDGGVTICEELMFNPNFLLGNIMEEDLQRIWKKNRLKYLEEKAAYHNSRCGKCKSFADCKTPDSKGVCWKEILHAYGEEKWNYPDPKCPHAPTDIRPFYV